MAYTSSRNLSSILEPSSKMPYTLEDAEYDALQLLAVSEDREMAPSSNQDNVTNAVAAHTEALRLLKLSTDLGAQCLGQRQSQSAGLEYVFARESESGEKTEKSQRGRGSLFKE